MVVLKMEKKTMYASVGKHACVHTHKENCQMLRIKTRERKETQKEQPDKGGDDQVERTLAVTISLCILTLPQLPTSFATRF